MRRSKDKQFIDQLLMIRNYWLSLNKDSQETLDGFIFSLCVMLDGESGVNDCHYIQLYDTVKKKYINDDNIWLHETLCEVKKELTD